MDVEADYRDVGVFARAVVAKRVGLIAGTTTALTLIVAVAAQVGVTLPDGISNRVLLILTGALNVLGLIVGVLWAQTGVTPVDPALNPTAADGTPLIHVAVAAAAVIAATTAVVTVDDPDLIDTTTPAVVPVDVPGLITVDDPANTAVDAPDPVAAGIKQALDVLTDPPAGTTLGT